MPLWKITLHCRDSSEEGWRLTELGIYAWEELSPQSVVCYLKGGEEQIHAFRTEVEEAGFVWAACELQAEINWVKACHDSWRVVQIGSLTIIPFLEEVDPNTRPLATQEIAILPALGFGTGHHVTTQMALELLQHPLVCRLAPHNALDLGTGSGILALATAKLYQAQVLAVDHDPLALENAAVNIRLNNMAERVKLELYDISCVQGSFDLVLANLYAELLCRHEPLLQRLVQSKGFLIISGIIEELYASVCERYFRNAWNILEERMLEGWHAVLLQQNSS